MRFSGSWLRSSLALVALLALAAGAAAADPIFGPTSYERTTGAPDTYTDTFTSPLAGTFLLWVQNGDDSGGQVSSGSIDVNGAAVVTESDFSSQVELIRKSVSLVAGANTITVTLNGAPGSFITVLILPYGERPHGTVGRLILPHASVSNLVLDLKNGSHEAARAVRIVFYDDAGNPVAASNRLLLAPRASFSQTAASLIANGSWTEGSVEVFYAGHGYGRVFGQAVPTDPTTGIGGLIELQQAGHRFLRHHNVSFAPPRRRR